MRRQTSDLRRRGTISSDVARCNHDSFGPHLAVSVWLALGKRLLSPQSMPSRSSQ